MNAPPKPLPETPDPGARNPRLPCDDIQALLFDYLARELGGNRAELVREHLRKCEACQAAAARMQKTMDWLKTARTVTDIHAPAHLSQRHYQRMIRAIVHPVMDWIHRHHILVSLGVALALLSLVTALLLSVHLWKHVEEERVPITIQPGPVPPASGGTP